MAEEGFNRTLAAILSADVEGYSRMMRDDEDATIRTLANYRSAISNLIEKFRGHVVDTTGDNLLAEFTSVVDAVNCAVEIQRELTKRNAELSEHRKMEFRIGVNMGDVVEEEGRIYGDGVNIAARMESLASAGGICISGSVYDSVESRLGLEYEFLGEQEVKNINKPIRAFRVLSSPGAAAHRVVQAKSNLGRKWRKIGFFATVVLVIVIVLGIWQFYKRRPSVEPAIVKKMALLLPDKPSIAVLAFDNMSGDPSQEYFSDGIAEQIITTLSNVGELFVISRNSSFSYKGKPVKIQKISEELGVRYVLEGSVRRSGDRVRVTAQLIDAIKGQHLWAESYDRDFKHIFEIQDEINMKIVDGLRITLTEGEQARIWGKTIKNPDAYLKALQALSVIRDGTREGLIRYGQLAQEIIDIYPESPHGYRMKGWYHYNLGNRAILPQENYKKAFKLAQKALSIDEYDGHSHALLSWIYLLKREYEKAIESGKRSVEILPNGAFVNMIFGNTLSYAGRVDEGIVCLKRAIRLNPLPAWYYYYNLGRCYLQKGQYEDALMEYQKALQRAPNAFHIHMGLAITYIQLGREEEARASAAKTLELNPNFTVTGASKTAKYKNQDYIQLLLDAMRKAGFPE